MLVDHQPLPGLKPTNPNPGCQGYGEGWWRHHEPISRKSTHHTIINNALLLAGAHLLPTGSVHRLHGAARVLYGGGVDLT